MIPPSFEYRRAATLEEAIRLLVQHGEGAKVLAGGHSLIPAMKLRLAEPGVLIDIGRIPSLRYIRPASGGVAIGALTTHYAIEASDTLRASCPLLPLTASHIGDVQVRNCGTIGGSLVHADPAADWPAAVLALDAELEIAGPNGRRSVGARDFFVGLFQSAVRADEILCEIRVPTTPASVAYEKTRQKASGFAVAGVAVVIDSGGNVRVGITGVAPTPYRATAVEEALNGQALSEGAIQTAAQRAAEGVEPLEDIHASAEYRAHLARVNTARALVMAWRGMTG